MDTALETVVLKGVSRSFYLSLRLLPKPMRRPAGVAYLLARTSDTIADSARVSGVERLECLQRFSEDVHAGRVSDGWPEELVAGTPDPRERLLLEKTGEIVAEMGRLREEEIALIHEVVDVIISGQRLDLERFGGASAEHVVSLSSVEELEDYTWRVAGCVGDFWTKLGYETLGDAYSKSAPEELLKHARDYGTGLQLVNILRDVVEDLEAGRCYLPVVDPSDHENVMRELGKWRKIALKRMDEGISYSEKLASRRLKVASAMPALIGKETLGKLENISFEVLREGVKIPRRRVYFLLLKALRKKIA